MITVSVLTREDIYIALILTGLLPLIQLIILARISLTLKNEKKGNSVTLPKDQWQELPEVIPLLRPYIEARKVTGPSFKTLEDLNYHIKNYYFETKKHNYGRDFRAAYGHAASDNSVVYCFAKCVSKIMTTKPKTVLMVCWLDVKSNNWTTWSEYAG